MATRVAIHQRILIWPTPQRCVGVVKHQVIHAEEYAKPWAPPACPHVVEAAGGINERPPLPAQRLIERLPRQHRRGRTRTGGAARERVRGQLLAECRVPVATQVCAAGGAKPTDVPREIE